VLDRGTRRRAQRRGQGGGEDEFGRVGTHRIHDRLVGGNVATHHAKTLGQRALDDVDAIHQAFALGDTAAARTIHAHCVHFIDIGQRPELRSARSQISLIGAMSPSIE
jgi:hypothetical protein